jgi:hypothetical protein
MLEMPRPDSQPAPTAAPPGRRRRWVRRVLVGAGIATPALILALWVLVNRVEWLGPYVADGLRAVVGVETVARLEDFAYGVQDRVNRVLRRGEAPKAYWEVPSAGPSPSPAAEAPEPLAEAKKEPETPEDEPEPLPPFRPEDVGPALQSWSAPGDGKWLPMPDARNPNRAPVMFKTLLHPDKNRSWAEVFVVAIDLRRVDIHLVPGSKEPEATVDSAKDLERPGVIPEGDRSRTMAAFNGGFKTEHGAYGMKVGDVTLLPPKAGVCALARFADGRIAVAPWESIAADAESALWWRQTPNCMIEQGKLHPRLRDEKLAKKWGATLDGETVIRRSAAGISADGHTLFVSISNNTTARAIAEGVRHAGAVNVAQLDVNFSYPKFVTFEHKPELEEGEKPKWVATALADGFEFSEDEYIRKKSRRDFFYVVPKAPDRRTARSGNSAD